MKTSTVMRKWTGPMTEELVLEPGRHGLGHVPTRIAPDHTLRSTCGFCSTGCSLDVHLRHGEPVSLSPTEMYPVNLGMACPKGWEAMAVLDAPDRATTPLVRTASGDREAASWEDAMQLFVSKFSGLIRDHGHESVAFLSTGQICTEEMAFLGALWKFGMGALHGDSNTRQCMATSHVAYKQSFGFDAPPFTYADFETSDVLILVGSNLCIAHPIMWQRVLRNPRRPRIVVIDPRMTETAAAATDHLAIRPKSDLILLYGVANLLIQAGWLDEQFIREHTTGYEAFAEFVSQFAPMQVSEATGLPEKEIHRLAEIIHQGDAVSFWWTMGVNQGHEATRTAQAIINLALMTGNIGRPGTGANSVTGQCNAMGSRLFANITSLFGGRRFDLETDRRAVAEVLGIPDERIPAKASLAYDQIIEGIEAGRIRGLWVVATNTAHSWGTRSRVQGLLEKLDFLVVQDLYATTETARLAHLILPAAGWGEKDGTLINSERRIGRVRKVRRAPGEALSDFNIFRLVSRAWGCDPMFESWESPEKVFQILKRLSAGQPCDITGIRDYDHIEASGGIQWPYPESVPAGEQAGTERRLFANNRFFHPDGRARFLFDAPRAPALPTDEHYPFVLLTGRGTSAQWHTNTRTGKSAVLRALYPQDAYVEIHPEDAHRLGVIPNSRVRLTSRQASIECQAFITRSVQTGQVFMPMHYEETNRLTNPDYDPHSRQPSYKYSAVRVEPAKDHGSH